MHNNSLLEILRTFTREELKRFDDFVSSPYFNKKSFVAALFKNIKKYYPEFNSPRLEREKVWKALYPDKEYNYGIFKNLVFDLNKLAENFLKVEYYLKDELQTGYNFLDVLNERELVKLFKTNFNSIEKSISDSYKKKNIPAENYFDFMSRLYLLKLGFSAESDVHSGMNKELEAHSNFLISNFLILLIKANKSFLSFYSDNNPDKAENVIGSFLDKADSQNMIKELLEYLNPKSSVIYKVLNSYYKMHKSIADKNSFEKYFDFKKALSIEAQSLSKADGHILYSSLIECLTGLNNFEINKSRETLDIAKLKIRDGVVLDQDGFISIISFISLIQTACNIGDSDFIEDFTKRFGKFIHLDLKENLEKFSLAHLYFSKKDFNKSLEQILRIDYDLFVMKYYLKDLQMMNYYELNDYESFLSILDSFKHFLSKNKSITGRWRKGQTLFGNYLNRLFKLREKQDLHELKKLKEEIRITNPQKKQWLLKKSDEAKANFKYY